MAPSDAETLLRALIARASVTPHAGDALDLVEGWLAQRGFACERLVFSAPDTETVENLFARRGTGAPHFGFAGHLDVVPTGPEADWSVPPFAGEVVDGAIVGRGAEDMKGGVAAFLAAAFAFLEVTPGFGGSISLLLTGDEEGPAVNGTVKVLEWMAANGQVPDHCLVGEPTGIETLGDVAKIGRRGSLNGHLTVTGRQGHVAYPDRAENPVPKLLRLADALLAPLDQGTAHFEPSNLEITAIDTGNPAPNVIPGAIEMLFNCRFNDRWSSESLEAELRARLQSAAAGCGAAFRLETVSNAESFLTPVGPFSALVSGAVMEATGTRPALTTGGGTSDARFITGYCPVIEFGLVGRTMHQVDERVPLTELEALTRAYRLILDRYFTARP
jgi:succinyl-diaminopimelate desuccinylase